MLDIQQAIVANRDDAFADAKATPRIHMTSMAGLVFRARVTRRVGRS
jgi:hypothetical protein